MFTFRIGSQLILQLSKTNFDVRLLSKARSVSYSSMAKQKIYITRSNMPKEALKILENKYELSCWSEEVPVPRKELLENIKGKDALFCVLTDKIDKQLLDTAGPNLKVIGTMSVGVDHIDVEEVRKRNIKIGYTPDILTDATAELTIGLLLATSRRLIEASQEVSNGGWKAWSPFWMTGPGLHNSTVGVVGFGRIGYAVAQRCKAFNVKQILYTSRNDKPEAKKLNAKRVNFDELLQQSDFVIATCALTAETTNLFNENAFKKMKSTAIFVNTSRGGVVDQQALLNALKKKTILAAGLDVMSPEPLPLDSPLLQLKNCVLLPHIGSATIETRENMAILTTRNICAALNNEPMPAELPK